MTKFTIITVVKNDEKNISRTIESVLSQTFKDFEYIIVDGYSSDNTKDVIKKYNDPRIQFFSINDNSVYEALNYGIKKSIGSYIAMLHSGDLFFDKNVLSKFSGAIHKNEIITSNCYYYTNNYNKIIRKWIKPFQKLNKFNSFKIAHTTMVIKKNIFLEIGYYSENLQISSDTEFILRLVNMKKNVVYYNINSILMKYGGKSTSLQFFKKKISEDLKIYFQYFGMIFIFFYILKIFSKLPDFINIKNFNK
ncbi:glycosyltransferase [Candidatus Pelagibacter sp. HIMB1542]|uniref:glycosyltransferase n=1 Tax=Candidatus Pelagibacter sp. HIMB1542 TaxID=3413346 RepID=UPI003F846335